MIGCCLQHRASGLIGMALASFFLGVLGCTPDPVESVASVRAMQLEGQYGESIPVLERLIEENPNDIDIYRLLGLALLASDNGSTAVWALRRVTEDPEYGVTDLFALAQALAKGGAHGNAREVTEEVLAIEPDHLGALLLTTNLVTNMKKWDDSLEYSERILELDPTPEIAQDARISALIALGRLEEAEQAIVETREMLPRTRASYQRQVALCQFEIDLASESSADEIDPEEKIEACLSALPNSVGLLERALEFYDERGEVARGRSLLQSALDSFPRNFEIRSALANLLVRIGEDEVALGILREGTDFEASFLHSRLILAEFLRDRDDFAGAARVLEEVLTSQDSVPERVMAEYADDLLQAKEFAKAEEVIGKLNRPEWVSLLEGRLLLETGEADAAMLRLQEGIRLWPGNSTARLLAARAAEKMGDFDWAISEYRDSIRGDIKNTTAVYELAGLYEAQGNLPAAFYPLRLRMERDPSDAEAGLLMVRLALSAGLELVATETRGTLSDNGLEEAALLAESMIEEKRNGPGAAAEVLSSAESDLADPRKRRLLSALVGYWVDAGREDEALSQLKVALDTDPTCSECWFLQGEVHLALGHPSEARVAFEEAVVLDGRNSDAMLALARLESGEGRSASAIDWYRRASEAGSTHSDAVFEAILLTQKTQPDQAMEDLLEDFLYDYPRHAEASILLAKALLDTGESLDRAEELAKRAVRFGAGPRATETLGLIALGKGDFPRAIRLFRGLLGNEQGSSETRYYLAQALTKAGRLKAAREELQLALSVGGLTDAAGARKDLEILDEKLSGDE